MAGDVLLPGAGAGARPRPPVEDRLPRLLGRGPVALGGADRRADLVPAARPRGHRPQRRTSRLAGLVRAGTHRPDGQGGDLRPRPRRHLERPGRRGGPDPSGGVRMTLTGFADLREVDAWNQDFIRESPSGQRYEVIADDINRAIRFMEAWCPAPTAGRSLELPVPSYCQYAYAGRHPQWGGGGRNWCSPTSSAAGAAAPVSCAHWARTTPARGLLDRRAHHGRR
ncbi:MAG: hypothetical protein HOY71_44160 [Nonomuraea sp.]|nr:hypothetical protein [Nonomuraea sp.]